MQLRKFTDDSPLSKCFSSKICPLIKLNIKNEISFYKTPNEKKEALESRDKEDRFLISWTGQWSTDVFEITEEDILEVTTKNEEEKKQKEKDREDYINSIKQDLIKKK